VPAGALPFLVRERRLPDAAQACTACNHDVHAVGSVPATDTAKIPGDGGTDPTTGTQLPLSGNVTGYAVCAYGAPGHPSCTAPDVCRSASVALPACTRFTSDVLLGGTDHTLASYLSTQIVPTFTASAAQRSVFADAGTVASRAVPRAIDWTIFPGVMAFPPGEGHATPTGAQSVEKRRFPAIHAETVLIGVAAA